MLTKDDLKQVGKVVDEKLNPVKTDVGSLKTDVGSLKKDVGSLKRDVSTLKRDVAETRNDIKTLIAYFDRDYVNLRKRIDRIEEHLGISDKN